jgi:hypothetical protein
MPNYRAFAVKTGSTTIVRSYNIQATDESEALERAARYVDDYDVELWEGERLIKRFDHSEKR